MPLFCCLSKNAGIRVCRVFRPDKAGGKWKWLGLRERGWRCSPANSGGSPKPGNVFPEASEPFPGQDLRSRSQSWQQAPTLTFGSSSS